MDNGFLFGDRATWDYPICKVEQYPEIPTPKKRFETYTIPGRFGELHSFEGSYEPIEKRYACYLHAQDCVAHTISDIKAWLLGGDAPRQLIDHYDLEHFFRASILSEISFENCMNRYSRFTVAFSCDPRAFRCSGELPVELSQPGLLRNPTAYSSQPLITIFGSGQGTLTISGCRVDLKALDGELFLDCEDMEAYRMADGSMVSYNGKISAPEYPVLRPGENPISWTGGVNRVSIIPRWFDL